MTLAEILSLWSKREKILAFDKRCEDLSHLFTFEDAVRGK
jgi:hypothetical protein